MASNVSGLLSVPIQDGRMAAPVSRRASSAVENPASPQDRFEASAMPGARPAGAMVLDRKTALQGAIASPTWNEAAQQGLDRGSRAVSDGIRDGSEWVGGQLGDAASFVGLGGAARHVKGFVGGLGEVAGGMVDGTARLVSHPVDTAKGLAHAVMNPGETASALSEDVKRVYAKDGLAGATAYAVGNAALLATGVVGAARTAGALAGKAGQLAKTAGVVSESGAGAARVAGTVAQNAAAVSESGAGAARVAGTVAQSAGAVGESGAGAARVAGTVARETVAAPTVPPTGTPVQLSGLTRAMEAERWKIMADFPSQITGAAREAQAAVRKAPDLSGYF